MEEGDFAKTSLRLYQTVRRHIPAYNFNIYQIIGWN